MKTIVFESMYFYVLANDLNPEDIARYDMDITFREKTPANKLTLNLDFYESVDGQPVPRGGTIREIEDLNKEEYSKAVERHLNMNMGITSLEELRVKIRAAPNQRITVFTLADVMNV